MIICLLLSLRINLHIIYEDEVNVYLRILFIKIKILPDTKKRFNLNKLTNKKKSPSITLIEDVKNAKHSSSSMLDKLNSIREILAIFIGNFRKQLHVKLAKIHISVATPDAAQTALLYGAVSPAVECIIDLIDSLTNLRPLKQSAISVKPDFLSEKSTVKLNIVLYVSVLGAIKVLIKSFINYYSLKNKTQLYNRKENDNG